MHTLKEILRYENGKLYWLPKKGNDLETKRWNTRYAGTEAGTSIVNGYKRACIGGSYRLIHRVIWEMFKGEIPDGLQIDHINSNRSDNRIENLQLVTPKQNVARSFYLNKGYTVLKNLNRPYKASRTGKYWGTPCGAYMSYMTAYI